MPQRIILASSSPRRRQLLRQIGVDFEVTSPNIDETEIAGETPVEHVLRLAETKAAAVAETLSDGIVLGSDTIVVLEGQILGKPENEEEAVKTLSRLSGHTHTVYTGFSLIDAGSGERRTDFGEADVTFRTLGEDEIRAYVATGSPMDKAGAYGIQDDLGAIFIERIDGDYYTVVGLPLTKVYLALREMTKDPAEVK